MARISIEERVEDLEAASPSSLENFANTDLTFDANRTHDTAGYSLDITTDSGGGNESYLNMNSTDSTYGWENKRIRFDSVGTTHRGAQLYTHEARTTTKTLGADDYLLNLTSGTFSVYLPTAVNNEGKVYIVKNSGTGIITLDADGTETIDGSLTMSLSQWDSITVVSDGANWIVTNYSTTSGSSNGFNNEFLTMGA